MYKSISINSIFTETLQRMKRLLVYSISIAALLLFSNCNSTEKNNSIKPNIEPVAENGVPRNLSSEFKDYWYAGNAEITSYKLTQERYGELRDGTAVTIFVTEDFLPKEQVKADTYSEENLPILKLNKTKKFITGIYPYSIMTSAFNPLATKDHALKVSNSVQEWCGQTYLQLNNRKQFELIGHSYFQSEGDIEMTLDKTWLEDELWNLIRINPEELPTGDVMVIPAFEFLRLRHKEPSPYKAYATLTQRDSLTSYAVEYPELKRKLTIYFTSTFPFEIEKWEETNAAKDRDTLNNTTTAVKLKRIKSAYWQKNSNADLFLRDSLQLK